MASTDIAISVVAPVYHIEDEYLYACLASLAAQTSDALEFVIVDDGSTPENAATIDAWVDKDSRFVAVHATNAGAATARNEGLDVARGQWVCFVDADDLVNDDFLSRSVPLLEDCQEDVVFFECGRQAVPLPKRLPTPIPLGASYLDMARALLHATTVPELDERFFPSTPWGKFFRRSWLEAHDVRFPDGVAKTHDTVFMLTVMASDPACSRMEALGYINRLRETSMSHKPYPNIEAVYDVTAAACERVIKERYPEADQAQLLGWLNYLQYCFMRIGAGRKVYAVDPLPSRDERQRRLRELTEHYRELLRCVPVSETRDAKDAVFLTLHKLGAYGLLDLAYLKFYGRAGQ